MGSKPWRLQPSHPDTHLLPSVFAAGRHLGLLTPALRGLLLVPQLQGEKAGCWKGPTAPASGARTHSYAGLSSRMLRPHAPRPRGGRGGSVGSSECLANGCAAFGSLEFSQPPLVSPPEGSLHLPGGPAQRGPRSPCLLATAHRALAQPPHRSSSPGTASAPSPDPAHRASPMCRRTPLQVGDTHTDTCSPSPRADPVSPSTDPTVAPSSSPPASSTPQPGIQGPSGWASVPGLP